MHDLSEPLSSSSSCSGFLPQGGRVCQNDIGFSLSPIRKYSGSRIFYARLSEAGGQLLFGKTVPSSVHATAVSIRRQTNYVSAAHRARRMER